MLQEKAVPFEEGQAEGTGSRRAGREQAPWAGWGGERGRVVLTNLGFLPSAASGALPAPGGPFRRSPPGSLPPRDGGEEGAR